MQKKPGKFSFQKGANEWWRHTGLAETSLDTVPRGKEGTWKWERRGEESELGRGRATKMETNLTVNRRKAADMQRSEDKENKIKC